MCRISALRAFGERIGDQGADSGSIAMLGIP